MKEGLLLDWIALGSRGVSPWNIQRPTAVVANFADSGLAFGNGAAMSASEAAHTVVLEFFVEKRIGFTNSLVQNTAERAHGRDLWFHSNASGCMTALAFGIC